MSVFGALPERLSYRLASVAVAIGVLVAAGLAILAYDVTNYRSQKTNQVTVQAQILAGSVTAALAFDDVRTAQEYLDALSADPDIATAAAYTPAGNLFASFVRENAEPPPRAVDGPSLSSEGDFVTVIRRVVQGDERAGYVLIRSSIEPVGRRVTRYAALLVLLVMATLAVAVFLTAQGAVRRANAQLVSTNDALRTEIQQRQRAEEALLQSRKMEAIGQLSGGIAHDFNNILQALGAGMNLIKRKPTDAVKVKDWAVAGLEIVERGAKLTSQLLAFSRLQRIELRPLVVSKVIGQMTDMLIRSLGPLIRVSLNLDDSGTQVLCDATQLEMAVLNLAVNARDAMPEGGALRIRSRIRLVTDDPELEPGRYVELIVEDTGQGMDPDIAARAFDPFFTTKPRGKGTGLGLSQVYGIAKQAGGVARIESRLGSGTEVRVYLRCTDQTATEFHEAQLAGGDAVHPGARLLVVDDDDSVRGFLVDALEDLGYAVSQAADGPSGLAMLPSVLPEVLLIDFAMPGMNGAEAARIAHERYPNLPIVFISGYADTAAIEAAMGPAAIFLRKPFRMEELQAILNRLLNEASSRANV